MDHIQRVKQQNAGTAPSASVFDTGTPAVLFVPPNDRLAPAPPAPFGDRFGSWAPSQAGARPGPNQPAPSPQSGGSTQVDPQKIRYLRRVDPDDIDSASQPSGQNAAPQPNRPLGLVNGKPMPNYPVPRCTSVRKDRRGSTFCCRRRAKRRNSDPLQPDYRILRRLQIMTRAITACLGKEE